MSQVSASSFELDSAIKNRVERLAAARQETPQMVVREAVEDYVSRAEKREEFLKAGMASLDEYRATGLHLTGDEVDEWLAKIEAGENPPMPECHV